MAVMGIPHTPQIDLEVINENHQNEIDQILKDASSKLNKFREQLETKKIELNAEAKLQKFMDKVRAAAIPSEHAKAPRASIRGIRRWS
jgi:hypothetical protein